MSVVRQRVGLGVSSQVVLDKAGSSVALVHPSKSHILVRGGSAEALLWNRPQRRVLQRLRVGVLAGLREIVQVEVARDERGGLAGPGAAARSAPKRLHFYRIFLWTGVSFCNRGSAGTCVAPISSGQR